MERIVERLERYMEIKGLNDNKVTVDCGLSVGLIGQARKGKSDIGKRSVDKILSKYQDLNRVWFLTGEGEMLNHDAPIQQVIGEQNTAVQGNGNNVNATAILEKIFESLRDQQKMIQEHYSKSQEQVTKAQELVSKAQEQMDRLITLLERR